MMELYYEAGVSKSKRPTARMADVTRFDRYADAYRHARLLGQRVATVDFRSTDKPAPYRHVMLIERRSTDKGALAIAGAWAFDRNGAEQLLFLYKRG